MKHNPYSLIELVAARAQRFEAQFGGPATPRGEPIISLDYGLADPALFPRAELLAATADVLDQEGWVIRVGTFSKTPKTAIHVIPHCIALTA